MVSNRRSAVQRRHGVPNRFGLCLNHNQVARDTQTSKLYRAFTTLEQGVSMQVLNLLSTECPCGRKGCKFLISKQYDYPLHDTSPNIERFAHSRLPVLDIKTDRAYIPMYWYDYHQQHGNGKYSGWVNKAVEQLVSRHPDKRFFTISQDDDGIFVDIPRCITFSASGDGGNSKYKQPKAVPIPIVCRIEDRHPKPETPKYLASFVGSIFGRCKLREELYDIVHKDQECYIGEPLGGETPEESLQRFTKLMLDSKFSLCPRGYGITSYRISESIRHGVVPVYISDKFWQPYNDEINWDEFCVMCRYPDDMNGIIDKLRSISDAQYNSMRNKCAEIAHMFTMDGICQYIKRYLERESE